MIMERHGISTETKSVRINESPDGIVVCVSDNGINKVAHVTPEEARYLASKLRRLAKRQEERS